MLDALLRHCVLWINSFPPRGGISNTYSPRTIITGKTVDYARQCRIPVGSYVQASCDNDNRTNTELERTRDSILLESKMEGGFTVMDLRTGEVHQVSHVQQVVADSSVLDKVDRLAGKDGMSDRQQPTLGMYVRSTGVWRAYTPLFGKQEEIKPTKEGKRRE